MWFMFWWMEYQALDNSSRLSEVFVMVDMIDEWHLHLLSFGVGTGNKWDEERLIARLATRL